MPPKGARGSSAAAAAAAATAPTGESARKGGKRSSGSAATSGDGHAVVAELRKRFNELVEAHASGAEVTLREHQEAAEERFRADKAHIAALEARVRDLDRLKAKLADVERQRSGLSEQLTRSRADVEELTAKCAQADQERAALVRALADRDAAATDADTAMRMVALLDAYKDLTGIVLIDAGRKGKAAASGSEFSATVGSGQRKVKVAVSFAQDGSSVRFEPQAPGAWFPAALRGAVDVPVHQAPTHVAEIVRAVLSSSSSSSSSS